MKKKMQELVVWGPQETISQQEKELFTEDMEKGRKIKFGSIDIIDVECWKQLNLKMTAEENLDELLKISEGKKERTKNVSCNCTII